MGKRIQKIINVLYRIRGYLPSSLPRGVGEFDKFCEDVFVHFGLLDNGSGRHAIATMILQLSPTTDKIPKAYFAKSVRKAMANQVAFDMMKELKEQDRAAAKAKTVESITTAHETVA